MHDDTPAPEDHTLPTPAADALTDASRILEAAAEADRHAGHLVRRLRLALVDLQLDRVLGPDWVRLTDEGLVFAPTSLRVVERFVCRLEDIAEGRRDPIPQPGTGQAGFDFDPVPGPQPAATAPSLHLEVGR